MNARVEDRHREFSPVSRSAEGNHISRNQFCADPVVRVSSKPPVPPLPREAVPDPACGHDAGNSVTEAPSKFATQTWLPSEVMPSGPSNP